MKDRLEIKEIKNGIALYHSIFKHEGFDIAAEMLFSLVKFAQNRNPGAKRFLYLDIDGHRNSEGGFDNDMFELQQNFILGFLLPYLSEVHMPLMGIRNPKPQNNDVPERLTIIPAPNKQSGGQAAATQTERNKNEDNGKVN